MKKFLSWLGGEFSSWAKWEYIWTVFCTIAITALGIYMQDTVIGILSAVTGTLYAIFAGKGRILCYFFGVINTLAYSYISYKAALYGEVMLNLLWYFPMMFAGVFFWRKNLASPHEIKKRSLTHKERVIALILTALGVILYAFILAKMKDSHPILDSLTTILSVTAMVMTVKRCLEQWILWTAVNLISIYMWLMVYLEKGESGASLIMWCIALANGIIFFVQWYKEVKKCPSA